MRALRRVGQAAPGRAGIAAILALGLAWGVQMHSMGWAQLSYFGQVRGLAAGHADIDPWHWETKDKAWIDGHFYSVKAPGLAGLTLPAYMALDAAGAHHLSHEVADTARSSAHPRWVGTAQAPFMEFGFDPQRASRVQTTVERNAPLIWALTLLGAVLPAIGLLLLVRWAVERLQPGYGTAAAITLGVGTIVMTFAAEYFSHVAAAALGFGAFALLMREREGPPRIALVAAAGLVAGLAVTFEYPLGLLGVILFAYMLSRPARRLPRTIAYGAGAVAGAAPALLYNLWSLGSPLKFAYSSAVAEQGVSGHAQLGLNSAGLFGITLPPRPGAAIDLLISGKGLLVLTPILVMGLVGAVLMRRSGRRAEGNVILAVAAVYFIYNMGYWLPLGGGTPGPRFLTPIMPFLAVGVAVAYRRLPALTLGLAIPSATMMIAGAFTYPLIGGQGIGKWAEQLRTGNFEQTILTGIGAGNGWLAIVPVAAAIGIAITLAVSVTPHGRLGELRTVFWALVGWAVVAVVGPSIAGDSHPPLGSGWEALELVAAGLVLSVGVLSALRYRERRDPLASPLPVAEPALGDRSA